MCMCMHMCARTRTRHMRMYVHVVHVSFQESQLNLMESFLSAVALRAADAVCDADACPSSPFSLLELLDADLFVPIVEHVDTRWHVLGPMSRVPLAPLAVCALGCVSRTILSKLKMVRPVIRTGGFGQAQSGALHRKTRPGPIQSVGDALAFERYGIWQIGQLSSLSYTAVSDLAGLSACRRLHTLQITECRQLRQLDGLGDCRALKELYLINLRNLASIEGVRGCSSLVTLEVAGSERIIDLSVLARCAALAHLSLPGCRALRDVSCLGACSELQTLSLLGCDLVDDVSTLASCPRLWKLDIRGTAYTKAKKMPPHLPSVKEMRGPGWQDRRPPGLPIGVETSSSM